MKTTKRRKKGFSLLELLAVLTILILLIIFVLSRFESEVNKSLSSTKLSEARVAYVAAQVVLLEEVTNKKGLSDESLEKALTGTVNDSVLYPLETIVSKRMSTLSAPDVEYSSWIEEGKAKVTFDIEKGQIVSMRYESIARRKLVCIITICNGETTVAWEKYEADEL